MGLDAVVHCDCFEKRKFSEPPPFPELIQVSEEGRPEIYSDDFAKQTVFDQWEARKPCGHEHFQLVHHWIGNIDGVSKLRDALQSLAQRNARHFPIIMGKVVYSGAHCGDMLNEEDVASLQVKMEEVRKIIRLDGSNESDRIEHFINQMSELAEASVRLNKPIVF